MRSERPAGVVYPGIYCSIVSKVGVSVDDSALKEELPFSSLRGTLLLMFRLYTRVPLELLTYGGVPRNPSVVKDDFYGGVHLRLRTNGRV